MFPAQEKFHLTPLGHKTDENDKLSCPSHDSAHDEFGQATNSRDWGACLPHHFNFTLGTVVCPRLTTRPDLTCFAISVLGAGEFSSRNDETPVKFAE